MENTHVGPFLIIKRLGANRRHKVYHARQVEQNKDVALKFISIPPTVERQKALIKIQREMNILQKLNHPNLVKVFGAGVHEDRIFLASEIVQGESLAALLSRRGKLAPDLAVDYARQIALLLEYLHDEEILHSKLTPDKILIDESGVIRVTDLRLNRSKRRRWDAGRQKDHDTAAYMAPEQFTEEGATSKSDIYALGVVLFEMLTGSLPIEPDTMGRLFHKKKNTKCPSVSSRVMECPIWLDRLVAQMTDPDPKVRPHSARAVIYSLEEIKKLDRSHAAAVNQVAGGFNPLTLGADKSEAKRLLGQKETREDKPPFYQSIPFLVGSILLIAVIMVYAIWPASNQKLMNRAEALLKSSEVEDWRQARRNLRKIMEQGGDTELGQKAEHLFYESRRRSLIDRADSGPMVFDTREVREFLEAYRVESAGDKQQAALLYQKLVQSVDPQGEFRHIFWEAESRLKKLSENGSVAKDGGDASEANDKPNSDPSDQQANSDAKNEATANPISGDADQK